MEHKLRRFSFCDHIETQADVFQITQRFSCSLAPAGRLILCVVLGWAPFERRSLGVEALIGKKGFCDGWSGICGCKNLIEKLKYIL